MPSGYGISTDDAGKLDWTWATERLAASRNYWVCTSSPDGRPHVAPVWGLWVDDAFFFATDPTSRKARDIASGSPVVVHLESGDEVVIIDGRADMPSDGAYLERVADQYLSKYGTGIDPDNPDHGMYVVRPTTAWAWREQDFPTSATRYNFSSGA
jgi:general stress protein 26